ncbi:uncharacterized protein SCHCODRAFT_01311185 [Schizophyllum commune H4-8]|uniref:uncharacterized protein n=1 Tax=Schizophyllum commune (strain H4-8 / FGSC 9210) TaxID=578458 RepID=UPI00216023CC|nr:uncharacterized protein SCHCODRAFT_01311185 [Schizophyllum commune H4-8]KAI5891548.1 hypothetical protein SCHCODRAFT_01311185 [Schizophyllum commune H4-8]
MSLPSRSSRFVFNARSAALAPPRLSTLLRDPGSKEFAVIDSTLHNNYRALRTSIDEDKQDMRCVAETVPCTCRESVHARSMGETEGGPGDYVLASGRSALSRAAGVLYVQVRQHEGNYTLYKRRDGGGTSGHAWGVVAGEEPPGEDAGERGADAVARAHCDTIDTI